MNKKISLLLICFFGSFLVCKTSPVWAGYKAHTWSLGLRESYPSRLTSEGVTIAVQPLFTDALAAQVFDKNDIVTRGIMPLAILIFNDNDFSVRVNGLSIELIFKNERLHTLMPNEVVYRLFSNDKSWLSRQIPIPRLSKSRLNQDALNDFDDKFLTDKTIPPHDKGGGFLYMDMASSKNFTSRLENAIVYIPKIYRQDNGNRLIFFEIELAAAIQGTQQR